MSYPAVHPLPGRCRHCAGRLFLVDGKWVDEDGKVHPPKTGTWRDARGVLKGIGKDEPAEVTIRRARGRSEDE